MSRFKLTYKSHSSYTKQKVIIEMTRYQAASIYSILNDRVDMRDILGNYNDNIAVEFINLLSMVGNKNG